MNIQCTEKSRTAPEWPHFCTLCIDLRYVSNPFTENIHWDFIPIIIFPFCCFIPGSLHLRPTVSCKKIPNTLHFVITMYSMSNHYILFVFESLE